jgi:hypothetical protein
MKPLDRLAARLPWPVVLFVCAVGAFLLGCCSAWVAAQGSGVPPEWPQ